MSDCENVKTGDFVAVLQRGWHSSIEKEKVTRVTKAVIEVGHHKYNRYGNLRGSSVWSGTRIEPWDETTHGPQFAEYKREVQKRELVNVLRATNWASLSLETLDELHALLAKHAATGGEGK